MRIDRLKQAFHDLAIINHIMLLIWTETGVEEYVFSQACEFMIDPDPNALLEETTPNQTATLSQHYSIHTINSDQLHQLATYNLKDCQGETMSTWEEESGSDGLLLLFSRGRYGKCEN